MPERITINLPADPHTVYEPGVAKYLIGTLTDYRDERTGTLSRVRIADAAVTKDGQTLVMEIEPVEPR